MTVVVSKSVYWFFELLFFIGCSLHLSIIYIHYMSYSTLVKSALMTPIELYYPRVSLCFDLITIVSNSSSVDFFGDQTASENFSSSTTIEDFFDLTPTTESLVSSCLYRDGKTTHVLTLSTSADCLQYFYISKYIMQSYICYLVAPTDETLYSFGQIASSMKKRRLLYQLTVNFPFNRGVRALPILHYSGYPLDARAFAKDILPSANQSELFGLSMDLFWLTRLPAPYDTNCGNETRNQCYYRCLNQQYEKMGSVGRSGVASVPSNLTKSGNADRYNASFYSTASDLCSLDCTRDACEETLPITYVSEPATSEEKLSFRIETISSPIHRIVHDVEITFDSFLTTLASILSIWFGSSVLGIVNLKSRLNRHHSHTEMGKFLTHHMLRVTYLYHKLVLTMQQLQIDPREKVKQEKDDLRTNLYSHKWRIILKVLCSAYRLLIVVLFSYEIFLLFRQYFKFETRLSVEYSLSPKVKLPNLAICVDLDELIFSANGSKYTEDDYDKVLRKANEIARDEKDILTLTKIFNKSLTTDEIVHGCRFRNELDYLIKYNRDECNLYANVTRFYYNWHMCYQVNPIDRARVFATQRIRRNVASMYSIIVNESFKKFTYLQFIVYYGRYPYISSKFLDQAYREDKDRLHTISYAMQRTSLLPAPYDTDCVVIGENCLTNCMIESCLKLNRLPVNEIIPQADINKPVISYTDLSNNTLAQMWREMEIACEKNCSRPLCSSSFTNTFISYAYPSTFPLEFSINMPTIPPIISRANARITLYEFCYQSLCCMSFWLGITICTLNIEKLYTLKQIELLDRIRRIVIKCFYLLVHLYTMIAHESNVTFDSSSLRKQFRTFITVDRSSDGEDKVERARKCKSYLSKFVTIIFHTLCITGCCFHSYTSARIYFKYPTVVNTKAQEETNFTPYSSSICFTLLDLLNHDDNSSVASSIYTENDLYTLSIGEMIDSTRNFSEMIKSCGYRIPRSKPKYMGKWSQMFADRMFVYESDPLKCSQVFNVTKYIMQEFICYNIKVDFAPQTSRCLNEPRMIYTISMDTYGSSGKLVLYLVHGNPSDSYVWSSTTHWSSQVNIPHYIMTYSRFRFFILPLPYDISQFNSHRLNKCQSRCFKRFLSIYDRRPTDQLVHPSTNDSQFRLIDLANKTDSMTKTLIDEMKVECNNECKVTERMEKSYETEEIVTTLRTSPGSQRDTINIYSKMTNSPVITVTFFPLITPVEFYLLMGNVFATWSGISMMKLNPFSFLINRQLSDSQKLAVQVQLAIQWLFIQLQSLQRSQFSMKNNSPIG